MTEKSEKGIVALDMQLVEQSPTKVMKSPIEMASSLIEQKVDPAFVEKMLDLQIKYEENEAKKAYFVAFTNFKKDPPKILKDTNVTYGTGTNITSYNHASLGIVAEEINKSLAKYEMALNWKQAQDKGTITVTCTLSHVLGYTDSTSLTGPYDSSGGKNAIQSMSSTNTYLERYTALAITGLATHDMDDDGQNSEIKYISIDQATDISDKVSKHVADPEGFYKYWDISCPEEIEAKNYNKIIANLRSLANG